LKIHFIVPRSRPLDRLYGCIYAFFVQHNIFLLSAATMLKKQGHEVEVTDLNVDGNQSLKRLVENDNADAYVFYSIFLSREVDLAAAAEITETKGHVPIVFMGSDPTYRPEIYLQRKNHFVVRGEPEHTLADLFQNLYSPGEVEGLSYVSNGTPVDNPMRSWIQNLDALPFPDRGLVKKPSKYSNPRFRKYPCTTILTSRGCAFKCRFCVPNSLSFARELEWKRFQSGKPPVTQRSPQNIAAELELIAGQGYRSVQLVDDMFPWGTKRTIEICRRIKHLNLEFSCLARADSLLDEEMVGEMAEAGFRHVDIGLESFNQAILDDIHKNLRVQDFFRAYNLLRKYDIEPEVNILIGSSPLETTETLRMTEKALRRVDPEILHCQICAPFPGTEFYDTAKTNGWMITKDYVPIDPTTNALISYPHLTNKDLEAAVRRMNRNHYLRPAYLIRQLTQVKSMTELSCKATTALQMVRKWGR
jgi:radical SAM superfamily enzyme YgiQ (UPF0313 family)